MYSTPVKPSTPADLSLLSEFIGFLRRPTYTEQGGSAKTILMKIWRLYACILVLLVPVVGVILALSNWIPEIDEHQLEQLLKTTSPLTLLVIAVVVAPVMEELLFRLPLRYSATNLSLVLGLVTFLGLSATVRSALNQKVALLILLIGPFLVFGFARAALTSINSLRGGRFFAKHLKVLIVGSALLFGLVHITNYPKQAWLVAPILVLPQTILGFFLAYVRLKFGILWSIFTHGLHNFITISVPFIYMLFGSEQLQKKILDPQADVQLSPQDHLIQGVMVVWILILLGAIIGTAVHGFRDWQNHRILNSKRSPL